MKQEDMVEVAEDAALECPYCHHVHGIDGGCSVLSADGKVCVIGCEACLGSYYYIVKGA